VSFNRNPWDKKQNRKNATLQNLQGGVVFWLRLGVYLLKFTE